MSENYDENKDNAVYGSQPNSEFENNQAAETPAYDAQKAPEPDSAPVYSDTPENTPYYGAAPVTPPPVTPYYPSQQTGGEYRVPGAYTANDQVNNSYNNDNTQQPYGNTPYTPNNNNNNNAYQPYGGYQPPTPAPKKHGNRTGLKIFAIVLAGVILIVGSYFAGAVIGSDKNKQNNNNDNNITSSASSQDVQGEDGDTADFDVNVESGSKAGSTTYEAVSKKVLPSVVSITIYSSDGKTAASASGVIMSKDGYILTNDHIYEGISSPKFLITLSDESEYSAEWVSGDSRSDLAILKMKDAKDLTPATFGSSSTLEVGEEVLAIGQSYGFPGTVTSGIVSALNRRVSSENGYNEKFIQTTAAINPGNSGGALINMQGQVIGITSAKIADSTVEGICFAIPIDRALTITDNLKANGKVVGRAQLGITYYEVSSVLADVYKLPTGLCIATINSGSSLSGTDAKKGDVITKVNGKEITNSDQMLDVVEAGKPGDELTLTIYKTQTKKTEDIKVKLIEFTGTTNYTTKEQESSMNIFDYFNGGNGGNDGSSSSSEFPFNFDY